MAAPENMSTATLRSLFRRYNQGQITLDEINEIFRQHGGGYSDRSGVYYYGERMGFIEERKAHHEELIPWKVLSGHNGNWMRRGLGAVARIRANKPSPKDGFVWARLRDALYPEKGSQMVVAYDPETEEGFRLVRRRASDGDRLIRAPQKMEELRGSLRTKIRTGNAADVAGVAQRIGLSSALLHRAGRADAADVLERLLVEDSSRVVAPGLDDDSPENGDADFTAPARRRTGHGAC